jgi:hypothetical protein
VSALVLQEDFLRGTSSLPQNKSGSSPRLLK